MSKYGQTMANTLQGINEKLKPSDGAGAYVKDFRKSDAPQFKGKSDKEIQKMAIAAYLDDKEENMNIGMNEKMMKGFVVRYTDKSGERLAIPYKTKDRAKEEVKALKKVGAKDIEITTHNLNFKEGKYTKYSDLLIQYGRFMQAKDYIGARRIKKDIEAEKKKLGIKEDNIQEDGHTDVASAIRQCKTMIEDATQIASKLQGMNPEESLPSWWTNKLAVSSNSMNKLRDYFLVPTTEETKLDEATMVSDISGISIPALKREAKKKNIKVSRVTPGGPMGAEYEVTFTGSEKDLMRYAKEHLGFEGKNFKDLQKHLNMGEGFASDAQRRAAFAQGYKAKGKKDKKEAKNYKYNRDFFNNDRKDKLNDIVDREGVDEVELAQYLAQKTGKDPEKVYFDGGDLVYGSKTIVRNAYKVTIDKLLRKVKQVREEEEKTKFEQYTGVPNPRTEGRRSNYATDDEDEEGANRNIIMQLYKAISLRGRHDVVFDDGKKVKVKEPIAIRAVDLHRQIQKPRERLAFQNKISKSYRDLLNAIR